VPVLEGLQREVAIVFDEVCSNRWLFEGLPLRPFGLSLVPVIPPLDGNRDGGNLGDLIVPPATVTIDPAMDDSDVAAFLKLADPRFEISPPGEEIHLVAVQFAAQTTDEAAGLARELHRDLPYPFRGFTDFRVHPMSGSRSDFSCLCLPTGRQPLCPGHVVPVRPDLSCREALPEPDRRSRRRQCSIY
jgi:hypothetical protein